MSPTIEMSMPLGDSPPGDDKNFNLEDGETHRATSSGCNPSVPIWDPEKIELRCMVDRLLEERRYLLPRPVEQALPHKVKVLPFWEKETATWFKLAEAVLEDNHVRDPWVMHRTVILHIPHHMLERVRGGPEPGRHSSGPFQVAVDRLVELLTPSELDQCTSILWGAEVCS